MARQRVGKAKAQQIRARLESFVISTWGSWYAFQRQTEFPRPTVGAWSNKGDPSVPDVPYLLQFEKRFGWNPSWLLLGIGPKRIEPTEFPEPIEERLRAVLVGDLATMDGLSATQVDRCLPTAEQVYQAALVEMRYLVRVMNAWDREADREKNSVRRQVEAAEKMGKKAKGGRSKRDLEGMMDRLKRERKAFMEREIAGRLQQRDDTPRDRRLEPRRPWPRHLA